MIFYRIDKKVIEYHNEGDDIPRPFSSPVRGDRVVSTMKQNREDLRMNQRTKHTRNTE